MRLFCVFTPSTLSRHCERHFTSAAIHTTSSQRAHMDCHVAFAMTADLSTATEGNSNPKYFYPNTDTEPTKAIKILSVVRQNTGDTMP